MEETRLKLRANNIRKNILSMIYKAQSGHPGGALGLVDIMTVLYFSILKHKPKQPKWKKRDVVFLSNGHTCAALYATLSECNYFPKKELLTFRQLHSRLQGHPHLGSLPGIEHTSGPLGQGINQAVGLAASFKRDNKPNKVFCFTGDGELQEGSCWEAALFASKEKLNNFIQIIDRNYIQIDGSTEKVDALNSLEEKYTAFGFSVITLKKPHHIPSIKKALEKAGKIKTKPVAIIAYTTPGKGISFMENNYLWHGKVPSEEEFKKACKELEKEKKKLKQQQSKNE